MTLSMNDFSSATAYPCGKNRKMCRSLLKEVPELQNVKMCPSVKDTLKESSGKLPSKAHTNFHE